jgi:hypothetical protein
MPLKSKAQMRWMAANNPEMLHEWAAHTKSIKKLPARVSKNDDLTQFSLVELSKAMTAPVAITPWDQARINRGKKRQRRLSEASAVLGLTALAATAPKAARHVARRLPGVSNSRALKAIARAEPKANAITAAATPLALGTGAAGSINFAHQQNLEVKAQQPKKAEPPKKVAKGLVKATPKKTKKANTVGTLVSMKEHAKAKPGHRRGGRTGDVDKKWSEHVSPAANNAYQDLGRRKRRRYSDAATYGGVTAAGLAGAAVGASHARDNLFQYATSDPSHEIPLRTKAYRVRAGAAGAASLGLAGAAGYGAVRRTMEGRSLEGRRRNIKAKGLERELASKALVPIPRAKAAMPIKPRMGGLMRMPSGKVVTRRGAIVGTNPLRRI